jgi:hypothetical protein
LATMRNAMLTREIASCKTIAVTTTPSLLDSHIKAKLNLYFQGTPAPKAMAHRFHRTLRRLLVGSVEGESECRLDKHWKLT